MRQLSGLDSTFLNLENATQFGHVSGLSIFTRPDAPGYEPYTAWIEQLQRRLHLLDPLRRRLAEVPLGLDHPFWIEDPDFDLHFHVRHTAVPPPGSDEQLANVVGRIVARPLDRRRPLWRSYVIEGLADDRFAVLTVFHHAAVDGASGMELLTLMLDEHPDGPDIRRPDEPWEPERVPTDLELLARAGLGLMRKPARAVLHGARTAFEIGQATRNPALIAAAHQVPRSVAGPLSTVLNLGRDRTEDRDPPPLLPSVRPPRTPFNRPIGPDRKLAIGSASLDAAKAIKNAFGATVNDVVLTVCAGGLRTWLARHAALPDDPLVALVPVSIRTGEEADRWTNRASMLSTVLPTDEPDPVKRLRRTHDGMVSSKEIFGALPAERLTEFAEFPPPAVFARAMRLSARLQLGSRLAPGNLVISNIPGPRRPLYAAEGAQLEHYFPVSVITEGQGLNITVQSYLDRLDFGLLCDPDLVPDVDAMRDAILADLDALTRAASSTAPVAGEAAATQKGGGRTKSDGPRSGRGAQSPLHVGRQAAPARGPATHRPGGPE